MRPAEQRDPERPAPPEALHPFEELALHYAECYLGRSTFQGLLARAPRPPARDLSGFGGRGPLDRLFAALRP
ncbi:MAG: hypothetical protein R3F62_17115 [Planctomycetota bacterium]